MTLLLCLAAAFGCFFVGYFVGAIDESQDAQAERLELANARVTLLQMHRAYCELACNCERITNDLRATRAAMWQMAAERAEPVEWWQTEERPFGEAG